LRFTLAVRRLPTQVHAGDFTFGDFVWSNDGHCDSTAGSTVCFPVMRSTATAYTVTASSLG
jgi:hypothetical protein